MPLLHCDHCLKQGHSAGHCPTFRRVGPNALSSSSRAVPLPVPLLEALARIGGRAAGLDGALLGVPLRLSQGAVQPWRSALVATIEQPCVCAHVRGEKHGGDALGAELSIFIGKKGGARLGVRCEHAEGRNSLATLALPPSVAASLVELHAAAMEGATPAACGEVLDTLRLPGLLPPPPSQAAIDRMRSGTWRAFRGDGRSGNPEGTLVGYDEQAPLSRKGKRQPAVLSEDHACLGLRAYPDEPMEKHVPVPAPTPPTEESASASMPPTEQSAQAAYDRNVCWECFDDFMIKACLRDWAENEVARDAAEHALCVEEEEAADEATRARAKALRQALSHFRQRHYLTTLLNEPSTLTDADSDGWRWQVVRYEHGRLAGDDGRRYAKQRGRALSELRSAHIESNGSEEKRRGCTMQSMPSDLRLKLCGRGWRDFDGYCSDLIVYLNLNSQLRRPPSELSFLLAYTGTAEQTFEEREAQRAAWHRRVAAHHGIDAATVKRWPNVIGNGGSYKTCCEKAGLDWAAVQPMEEVERMQDQLRALKEAALASPKFRDFVAARRARLKHLSEWKANCKIFSQLVGTMEDDIMAAATAAARELEQEAIGEAYSSLPIARCDAGAYAFDGTLRMDLPSVAPERVQARMNEAVAADEWQGYQVREKPFFGLQDQPMETWVGACKALDEAPKSFPRIGEAIRQAQLNSWPESPTEELQRRGGVGPRPGKRQRDGAEVDGPVGDAGGGGGGGGALAHRRRWTPCGTRPAFVLMLKSDHALLTREVRGGVPKYGLLGGKGQLGETRPQTASREAFEETGRKLSAATCQAIATQATAAECPTTRAHVFLHRLAADSPDADVHLRFDRAAANRSGSDTVHEGLEWVPIASLRHAGWQKRELHLHAQFLVRSARHILAQAIEGSI